MDIREILQYRAALDEARDAATTDHAVTLQEECLYHLARATYEIAGQLTTVNSYLADIAGAICTYLRKK